MHHSFDELGPISFSRAEELNRLLPKLSRRTLLVLFACVARVVGNRVFATQEQIGKPLGLHRSAVCKAFTELRKHLLVFPVKRGVYTVNPGYFWRDVSVADQAGD